MKKSYRTKRRLTGIMAVFCCLSLLVGSLAFFTDRESKSAGATAGNIDLVWEDTSKADVYGTADQTNTKDAVWGTATQPGAIASSIINPGDQFDMGYKLTNTGSKSIDVKQQLVVTSNVPMTAGTEEYQLKVGGVTSSGTLVFGEHTLNDFSEEPGTGIYATNTGVEGIAGVALTEGTVYTVVWDGVSYVCTAQALSFSGFDFIGLGDLSILGLGADTNEPFVLGYVVDWDEIEFETLQTSPTHTVAIYEGDITTGSGSASYTLTPTVSADKMTITYTLPEIVLTGTQEASAEIEGADAINGATGIDYDIYLEFARTAKNAFMGSSVSVALDVQAKQHRNTGDSDWASWASYKTAVEQIN